MVIVGVHAARLFYQRYRQSDKKNLLKRTEQSSACMQSDHMMESGGNRTP